MKKLLAALFMIGFVAGCGQMDRSIAGLTGSATSCVDGVAYLQFTSGVTVKYKRDGSIQTC